MRIISMSKPEIKAAISDVRCGIKIMHAFLFSTIGLIETVAQCITEGTSIVMASQIFAR
jgi:hypothetical protein